MRIQLTFTHLYAIINESCHTYEWVISRRRMSHVTHTNESCHTYDWVMSRMWMSHVTHTNESCHTYDWVMSHIWMSHVTNTNESRHTYEWVMSHIWMSHVAQTNESCHSNIQCNIQCNIQGSQSSLYSAFCSSLHSAHRVRYTALTELFMQCVCIVRDITTHENSVIHWHSYLESWMSHIIHMMSVRQIHNLPPARRPGRSTPRGPGQTELLRCEPIQLEQLDG